MLRTQRLEHVNIGGVASLGLFLRWQPQFYKQHVAELFGGIEVEVIARVFNNRRVRLIDPVVKLAAVVPERLGIEREALAFHSREHARQRHFNLIKQLFLLVLPNFIRQLVKQRGQRRGLRRKRGVLLRDFAFERARFSRILRAELNGVIAGACRT